MIRARPRRQVRGQRRRDGPDRAEPGRQEPLPGIRVAPRDQPLAAKFRPRTAPEHRRDRAVGQPRTGGRAGRDRGRPA
ncbi:hypothetical protein SR39_25765 [Methylobacterium radiotolerans]|nr:hypothetical protein SR39_25765 [Methylobacterium radiotolerans]